MRLVDTHCHIHDTEFLAKYEQTQDHLIESARADGVDTLICVGTDSRSSFEAVEFARTHEQVYASVALHPHEASASQLDALLRQVNDLEGLMTESSSVVAIGECGLDYYYHEDKKVRATQETLFRKHIELAVAHSLPLIFHIRNAYENASNPSAFDDFFRIIDEYKAVRGVVHSFSAGIAELDGCIKRGLYVGLNGIMTFSKQTSQLDAAKAVPKDRLLLETDAPYLTPAPFRGKMCEPKHLRVTAEFLSGLRGESLEDLANQTTDNAQALFGIK